MNKYFILLFVSFILLGFKHPIHISVVDINFNKSTAALEVSQKIFLDDIELAFKKNNIDPVKIGDSLTLENQKAIEKYLKTTTKFIINDSLHVLLYVGAEIEEDALWCYYEVKTGDSFHKLELLNTVLFDVYDDQRNLINITVNDKITTLLFHKQNPKQFLKIN